MKIATVTWLKYYNYGTYLQAYALRKKLELLGHDAKVINDKNVLAKYTQNKKQSLFYFIFKCIRYPFNGKKRRYYRELANKETEQYSKFEEFKNQFIEVENNTDSDYLNTTYDLFICGSDQIWSPIIKNFNPYYYLDFVKDNNKKVSYAPSLGINNIDFALTDEIKTLLNSFRYISIREQEGKDKLSQIINKNIEVVLDPTLLLNSGDWDEISSNRLITSKYLLCYFLGNKEWYREYAIKLAKKKHLQVVILSSLDTDMNSKYLYKDKCGPNEFISLLKYADYIITDSFHGTVFSLIYNKEFIAVKRFDDDDPASQNSRVYNLLNKISLANRFLDKEQFLDNIDYNIVNKLLAIVINNSENYLKKITGRD